jgi:hypothetical protein
MDEMQGICPRTGKIHKWTEAAEPFTYECYDCGVLMASNTATPSETAMDEKQQARWNAVYGSWVASMGALMVAAKVEEIVERYGTEADVPEQEKLNAGTLTREEMAGATALARQMADLAIEVDP